ncbi:MAG: phosphate signaling complex protein PhoU [Gammaproteobacteria bacterium]|nr:phosphate signaling complex protein PhoU [Gammaproteobacteria bacterium]
MSLHFIREMKRLNKHLIELSDIVEEQVGQAIHAISDLDKLPAQTVIDDDSGVDRAEIEMEEDCLKLLALHQPVANDLRLIISVLKINSDLERIGDHAVIIAEEVITLASLPNIDVPEQLFELSAQARMMLKKSMLAFVESDLEVAKNVLKLGQNIRQLAENIYREQVESIKASPQETEQRLSILKICRQLQRIADHATNIAEDIIFLMSGDIIRHKSKLQ